MGNNNCFKIKNYNSSENSNGKTEIFMVTFSYHYYINCFVFFIWFVITILFRIQRAVFLDSLKEKQISGLFKQNFAWHWFSLQGTFHVFQCFDNDCSSCLKSVGATVWCDHDVWKRKKWMIPWKWLWISDI